MHECEDKGRSFLESRQARTCGRLLVTDWLMLVVCNVCLQSEENTERSFNMHFTDTDFSPLNYCVCVCVCA